MTAVEMADQPPAEAAKAQEAAHAQRLEKSSAPAVQRSVLLSETAQCGRCQHEAPPTPQPGAASIAPIQAPGQQPQTKAQVLQSRLEQVQRLKAHYAQLHQACLAHLPVAAASLPKAGYPVLQPQTSTRKHETGKSAQPVAQADVQVQGPGASQPASGTLTPLGPAVSKGTTAQAALVTAAAHYAALQPYSEAEAAVLNALEADLPPSSGAAQQRATHPSNDWLAKQAQLPHDLAGIADHERMAAGATAADMDERDACAVLCGSRHRFYLHQTVVLIGRESKSKGEVDVNLLLEKRGLKVSRLQCLLEMDLSYGFVLRNIGRQSVYVNSVEVTTGKKIKVPHLSLIEIGGVQLLLVLNIRAVQRACLQQPPLPKQSVGF